MPIAFNPKLKLILADVDETLADVYTDADPLMIKALNSLIRSGINLFLVSGGGLSSIHERVTSRIEKNLRKHILIGHSSGAEVHGFSGEGELNTTPFYSLYEERFTAEQKLLFRKVVAKVISDFGLIKYPTMKVAEFIKISKGNPQAIMFSDRGPQITLEMVNSYNLIDANGKSRDMRSELTEVFRNEFEKSNLPVEPAISGVFALDLKVKGVSKVTAIKFILENDIREFGYDLGLTPGKEAQEIELWGDKFSEISGSDKYLSYALPKSVRAIDSRLEPKEELPEGYNIVIWDGEKHLHEGCLEYLNSYFN